MACHILGGGQHLVATLHERLEQLGIPVLYDTTATALLHGDARIEGVRVRHGFRQHDLRAGAVVMACGGFESNPEMRARYLGPNWDLAKVRGTKYNTGNGHRMAIDIGAAVAGHWSGAHAVQWDMNAPPYGDLTVGDRFQKHNYPFGVLVNARGERFLDEGLDFHSYTYAKYGHEVMKQPGLFAWQIFDAKIVHLLREEYRIARITKEQANTLEELAPKLTGVDTAAVLDTLRQFNAAPRPEVPFNPNIHDGLRTFGLTIDKTNWAQKLDTPPFHAYGVTAGVTFTFGGLKTTTSAEVEDTSGVPIPGLYAAGEILGGLYFHNYGSGTGLVAGVVFGRIAGEQAAGFVARSAHGDPRWIAQRLQDDAVAFGRLDHPLQLRLIGIAVDLEAQVISVSPTGTLRSMPSVPRASQVPSAITRPLRIVTPDAVATARSVTPAQAATASSSISAEQARSPVPPVARCRPACVSPCQDETVQAIASASSCASARAGTRAASGVSR